MPLYSFECKDCEDEFEELVISSSQTDQVCCPTCGSSKVQRQLSQVAAIKISGGNGASLSNSSCAPSG